MWVFILALLFMLMSQMMRSSWVWLTMVIFINSLILGLKFINCSFLSSSNQYYPFYIDVVAVTFMLLSVLVVSISMMCSLESYNKTLSMHFVLYSVLLLILLMFFSASNFFFFFFFFESSLIPIFLIVSVWGNQPERVTAGYYMMMYTIVSGFPLFGCVLVSLMSSVNFYLGLVCTGSEYLVFSAGMAALCLAFLVKLPLYGMHLWLPKAHVEAPVGGSMVLASVLLKLSSYSLMRFVKLFVAFKSAFYWGLLVLSIWSGCSALMACTRQQDIKAWIAYSSVGHMSLGLSGLLMMLVFSFKSGYIMFLGHGLVSPMVFFLGYIIYKSISSRNYSGVGSLGNFYKGLGLFFFLIMLINMSVPPMINFFGEVLMYFAFFQYSLFLFAVLMVSMVFAGAVVMKMYSKMVRSSSSVYYSSVMSMLNVMVSVSVFWALSLMTVSLVNL